jgi:hypothetical protein
VIFWVRGADVRHNAAKDLMPPHQEVSDIR